MSRLFPAGTRFMQSRDTSILIFGVPDESIAYQARPASYVVITDHQGRVAAVKGKTHYFLPGGGAIDQETPEQTVRREVMEELSREVHIIGQIGKAIQYFNADGRHYRMEAVYFAGEFGSESIAKGEHELCWLEVEQIEERFFHKSHVWAVRQASGTTF
jgi:8-oxo-dGTP pyrophosphatase MutT (NUDIX family)